MNYFVYHLPEKHVLGIARTKDAANGNTVFPSFRLAKKFAVEAIKSATERYRKQIKENQDEIKRLKTLTKKDVSPGGHWDESEGEILSREEHIGEENE